MHFMFIFAKWGNAVLDGGWYLMSYELSVGVEIGQTACQGPVAWPVFSLAWPNLFKNRIRLRPVSKPNFLIRPSPGSI